MPKHNSKWMKQNEKFGGKKEQQYLKEILKK